MSTTAVVDSSSSSNEPDYSSVDLPTKPATEYSYVERRAELLQLVTEAGTPDALNQTELADRYGVSQQQISKDLDRLARHVHTETIDRDRRAFFVDRVVRRSIKGLLAEEEWRDAARTAMEFDDWLENFHDLTRLTAEVEELKTEHGDGAGSTAGLVTGGGAD